MCVTSFHKHKKTQHLQTHDRITSKRVNDIWDTKDFLKLWLIVLCLYTLPIK